MLFAQRPPLLAGQGSGGFLSDSQLQLVHGSITTAYPPADFPSRAVETTLSPAYQALWRFPNDELDEFEFGARPMVVTEALQMEEIPIGVNYRTLFGLSAEDDDLMQHYLHNVMPIQVKCHLFIFS